MNITTSASCLIAPDRVRTGYNLKRLHNIKKHHSKLGPVIEPLGGPSKLAAILCLLLLSFALEPRQARAQDPSLEQRQPLELVHADSIVPQDRHETMLTTGGWYSSRDGIHDALLTQKVEWGISGRLQVSTFVVLVHGSNRSGQTETGVGDFDLGARYTWPSVRSPFTHVALALEAGFPTGDPRRELGEGAYTLSPSLLLSHEFRAGKYQLFSSSGLEFVTAHRSLSTLPDGPPHHSLFTHGGFSRRTGRGWAVAELSLDTDRWNGGDETQVVFTPSYVWRAAGRTELLLGVPIGLTSSTDRVGAVFKFTFELGGEPD
jgi:hypothetical protein